jgi:hypothetical protein
VTPFAGGPSGAQDDSPVAPNHAQLVAVDVQPPQVLAGVQPEAGAQGLLRSSCTAEHSAQLSDMLLDAALAAPKSGRVAAIQALVARTVVLNQPTLGNWLPELIAAMASQSLHRAQQPVLRPLAELNGADGKLIGWKLSLALATCVDATSAVDEWLLHLPAMQEACAAWPWFKPMVVAIVQRRLKTVGWGVTFRVILCLLLTYADMSSDLYSFFQYRNAGQEFFANATLTIFCLSMLVQLVLVIGQDQRSPLAMLKGMLLVLSFLKPAADARRVVVGAAMEAHQIMPPAVENIISKVAEVAFESGPAAFVQTWAFVLMLSMPNHDRPTTMQFCSIFSSVLTAAFVAASVSCELHPRGAQPQTCKQATAYSPGRKPRRNSQSRLDSPLVACERR